MLLLVVISACGNEKSTSEEETEKAKLSDKETSEINYIEGAWEEILTATENGETIDFEISYSNLLLPSELIEGETSKALREEYLSKTDSLREVCNTIGLLKENEKLFAYAEKNGWDKLSEEDIKGIEKGLRKSGDEFSDVQFLHCKSSPKYVNKNGFWTYISYSESFVALKWSVQYLDDDWLFIDKMQLLAGENKHTLFGDWEHDHSDGEIYEWVTYNVVNDNIQALLDIVDNNGAKIKFVGSKYYDERKVSEKQAREIGEVLKVYYFKVKNSEASFDAESLL